MYVLRTNAEHNFLAHISAQIHVFALGGGDLDAVLAEGEGEVGAVLGDGSVDEVHLRRTHEPGHELVAGVVVQVLRSVNLLNEAVLHNHDAVAHGHSLGLVMRYIDEGGAQSLM